MSIRNCIVTVSAAIALLASAAAFALGYLQEPELLDRIKPGVTTAQEVEQILGPPANRSSFPRLGLVSMDYVMRVWNDTYDIGIMIDKGGVVRDIQKIMRTRNYG